MFFESFFEQKYFPAFFMKLLLGKLTVEAWGEPTDLEIINWVAQTCGVSSNQVL